MITFIRTRGLWVLALLMLLAGFAADIMLMISGAEAMAVPSMFAVPACFGLLCLASLYAYLNKHVKEGRLFYVKEAVLFFTMFCAFFTILSLLFVSFMNLRGYNPRDTVWEYVLHAIAVGGYWLGNLFFCKATYYLFIAAQVIAIALFLYTFTCSLMYWRAARWRREHDEKEEQYEQEAEQEYLDDTDTGIDLIRKYGLWVAVVPLFVADFLAILLFLIHCLPDTAITMCYIATINSIYFLLLAVLYQYLNKELTEGTLFLIKEAMLYFTMSYVSFIALCFFISVLIDAINYPAIEYTYDINPSVSSMNRSIDIYTQTILLGTIPQIVSLILLFHAWTNDK